MKLLLSSGEDRKSTFVQTDVELRDEIDQLREEKKEILVEHESRLSTIKRCLILTRSLLIHRSHWEKKRVRRTAMDNRIRLGHYRTERHGISLVEQWIEGNEFTEKQRRRTELEGQRRDLLKRKSDDDEEEVLRLRHLAWKREENQLADELDELERERHKHRRELRRLEHENQSEFNHSRLLHHRYLLLALIHKGTNSELHRAFDFREQSDVLCQIHLRPPDLTDDEHQNIVRQLNENFTLRQSLRHPHLVRSIEFFEIDARTFCTAMEFCDGGDLENFLQSTPNLPEREARVILLQLINALKSLPNRIHVDLRAKNILFKRKDNCGEMKLINVSAAKDEEEKSEEMRSVADVFYRCLYGRGLPSCPLVFPPRPSVSPSAKVFIRRCLTDDLLHLSDDEYLRSCPKRLSLASPSTLFSTRTNECFT